MDDSNKDLFSDCPKCLSFSLQNEVFLSPIYISVPIPSSQHLSVYWSFNYTGNSLNFQIVLLLFLYPQYVSRPLRHDNDQVKKNEWETKEVNKNKEKGEKRPWECIIPVSLHSFILPKFWIWRRVQSWNILHIFESFRKHHNISCTVPQNILSQSSGDIFLIKTCIQEYNKNQ